MVQRFTISNSSPLAAHKARQSDRFFSWEKRGRGWQTWDYTVDLEPPFEHFTGHSPTPTPVVDDAREPGLIRSLFKKNKTGISTRAFRAANDHADQQAAPAFRSRELSEIQVALPPKLKISPQAAEQFLLSLANCKLALSLEIIGLAQSVSVQLACDKGDQSSVEQQLLAYWPEAILSEQPACLSRHLSEPAGQHQVIVDFGLASEFLRPLATASSFDPDPLTAVVGALSRLRGTEVGLLQVLFRAARHSWAESMMRAVSDKDGRPFFFDAPDSVMLARQKVSRPLFAAVVRVAAKAASEQRAWRIVRALGGAFNQLAKPASNQLIPLSNEGLLPSLHQADLLNRETHRSGMILNSEELSCLVHLPSASLRSEKLVRENRKRRPAPQMADGELTLGYNTYRGRKTRVTLNREQRLRHTFIAGATGSGKTTLLKTIAISDMENGNGICVIEPHGDLIDELLEHVPESRYRDVVLIDPADVSPVPLNILSGHTEIERTLLASDLTSIFRRLASTTWGDQMDAVLSNAVLAFVESSRGGTLFDLRRFLSEADFRSDFLSSVQDEEVLHFWQKQFPILKGNPQASILTRLNSFLRPKPIRQMLSHKEGLDFRAIMDSNKIVFVRLAQGAIGIENSHFLGSLILSKLHHVALSRQNIEASERKPFHILCDEVQYFVAPSLAALLSGGRKFAVSLTAATQEFFALWQINRQVASAILANAYTRVLFRLSDLDAKRLQQGLSHFDATDLQNLGIGEAIVRLEKSENDFNLETSLPTVVDQTKGKVRRENILQLSRGQYGSKSEQANLPIVSANIETGASKPAARSIEKRFIEETTQPHSALEAAAVFRSSIDVTQPPPTLGRGGQQHKYLQNLIKRLAEDKGFRVTIEQPVLSGAGSVDVSLERAGHRIACEISVSSTSDYECNNIRKCLAAGFEKIVVLSSERKRLTKIRQMIEAEVDNEKVLFLQPEEFIVFLDQMDAEQLNSEKTVRGYKVKVKHKASPTTEQKGQRHAVAQVILQALKRLKHDA
jgi:hypothetical protein